MKSSPDPSPSQLSPALDFNQLAAETLIDRGEIWLLHWLKNLDRTIDRVDQDALKSHQAQLESDLLRIITQISPTSHPAPKPGRPIRHLIARILVKLFHRAERRTLFDVIESLLKVAGTEPVKNAPENKLHRIASFYVVGQLMQNHGLHVMSQFAECLMTSIKVLKSSTSPPILKSQALFCLNSALIIGAQTLSPTDNLGKEVLKTLRYALADKTFSIVRGSAECLLTLSDRSLNLISSLSDIEAYLAICFKTLEVVDFDTRRSSSKLIASLLASTQVFGSAVMPTAPITTNNKSKRNKDDQENDQDPYPTTMTAEEKGKTLLTPEEMLSILNNQYSKPHTSRQARNGLIEAQATLFTLLGTSWVEQFYPEILHHVIFNIGSSKLLHPNPPMSVLRHDTLVSRKLASTLLREVISMRLLSEQGQILAIREISSSIINKWPALMPTHQPPPKTALVIALNEVSGLLEQVGCATQPIQEVLYNPLIRLLGHPSYSVQISSALCLRTYCLVAPGKLTNTINNVLDLLHKDLSHLGHPGSPSDVNKRAIGHAHGLAGLISLISLRPLYVSFDISSKIMLLAIQLLKDSGAHELRTSIVEIQVAWILVSALMSLGPNFVRIHLPQLLLLWKNAFPKPTLKDLNHAQLRTDADWTFLLHLRECTLGSILSFLQHDGEKLLTLDIARRIVMMLSNALSFLSEFEKIYPQTDQEPAVFVGSKLGLGHWELLMRRRLFQCSAALNKISMSSVESIRLNLLDVSLGLIGDPEKYTGSSVQAAISASTGSFTSVWDSVDGFSFGVTSLLKENECLNNGDQSSDNGLSNRSDSLMSDWLNRDLTEVAIASVLQQPCIESYEHDSLVICTPQSLRRPFAAGDSHPILPAPPVTTATIDAALELFALYFPLVNTNQQATILDRLCKFNHSAKIDKNLGRKMAILVNSVTALLLATKSCMNSGFLGTSRQQLDPAVVNLMKDILKEALVHPDIRLRSAAAQTFGRACALGGNNFMLSQIQHCVTQVVNNADPDSRSGYALAFSQIYTQVGSLSAGATLKTIVDVLMSLSADPHPSVHFWALRALSEVIHTAGLSYTPFLNSTLGMVVKLYCSDTHEIESGGIGYVNLRASLPSYQNFCKILNAMIGVLGPELSNSGKSKSLIQLLNEELNEEIDEGIQVEVLKSIQHFMIFSIESIDLPKLIQTLRKHLSSNRRTLKVSSINSIYQLVQKNAPLMSKLGGDKLVVELFSILDDDPTIEGVRDSIKSWLRQTADSNPSAWIDLCMRIISRTKVVHSASVAAEDQVGINTTIFIDEESQGLDLDQTTADRPNLNNHHDRQSRSISSNSKSTSTVSRWRTQLFALRCLREVFSAVIKNKKYEHFHVQLARSKGLLSTTSTNFKQPSLMFFRVSDLIKMAFTASTANNMEIRLEGLNLLRDVIENFKESNDIDFDESPLLEQHQAPIAAAITPAFSNDSFPEVLASAIQVCAVFVGSGVVKEIDKMGRILKLLTSALQSCKASEITSLGEMKDLSATASIMIKTSVYAAWAEFQVISIHQAYLSRVIKPHLTLLCPLWVSSLREYARLKSDEDSSLNASSSVGTAESLQGEKEGLYREISLPYYEEAWLKMMKATSSLIKAKNPIMLQALDGMDWTSMTTAAETGPNSVHRSEPVLNFYVLLGLVYEAITSNASIGTEDPTSKPSQIMESAVYSLEALLQIEMIGSKVMTTGNDDNKNNNHFWLIDEICGLCSRLTATESARVQLLVLRVVRQLAFTSALCFPSQIEPHSQADLQLNQCLSVFVQILINWNPGMSSMASSKARKNPKDYVALVIAAYTASADLADRFTSSTREHIYGVLLGVYSESLKDDSSSSSNSGGVDIVGPTLPALKLVIERGFSNQTEGEGDDERKRLKKDETQNLNDSILSQVLNQFILEILENLQDGLKKIDGSEKKINHNNSTAFISISLNLRNNLLACGLIFTTTSPRVPISRLALVKYCTILSQLFLNDSTELGATAIHCSKSLVLNSKQPRFSSSIFQVSLTELLWAYFQLIYKVFSGSIVEDDNDDNDGQEEGGGKEDRSSHRNGKEMKPLDPILLSFVAEMLKILSGVVILLPNEKRPQGLAMILPIYLRLIESEEDRVRKGASSSNMGATQVLQLASIDSISFKVAMNSLDQELKINLESALRGSISKNRGLDRNSNLNHLGTPSTSTNSNSNKAAPSIELKSFG